MTKVLYYKSKQWMTKYCITKVNKDVWPKYCIAEVHQSKQSKQMYDQSIVLQK